MTALNFFFVSTVFLSAIFPGGQDQSQEKQYSTLILNFARGMQWPAADASDEFVIGVIDYQPLASELGKGAPAFKAGSKKIVVRELSSSAIDLGECHILFVPAYKSKSLTKIIDAVGTAPTVIVTNKPNLARQGSAVNFVLIEGKLKYEINTRSIESRGVRVSAGIKGMGIIVD